MYDQNTRVRFWAKVHKTSDCWIWTAANNKKKEPYGLFNLKGKTERAHRVAYEMEHGRLQEDVQVLHHCDNTLCVRPSHLFLGDHDLNMRDKVEKGRQARTRGEEHPGHKLTEEQVYEILVRNAAGETQETLGRAFGVRQTSISNIVRGYKWPHVWRLFAQERGHL